MSFLIPILSLFSGIDVFGYLESRPYVSWNDSINISGYNRGWLEFKSDESNYGVQLALDLIIPYDTITLGNTMENIDVSRLALWLGPEHLRTIVGKQRLYWGVARVFCPLDIFNPVNFFEPGYERPGSNAILGYVSLGSMTSIRGICVPVHNLEQSLAGVRIGTNYLENDFGINLMHQSITKKTILGGEIAGELMVGYWAEYSYVWEDTIDYSKFSIGCDYTFPLKVYTMVEFFFDGSGERDSDNYDYVEIISGEKSTLAQHYLYLTVSTIPDPFAVFRPLFSSLINIDDQGLILMPRVSMSIFENTEIISGLNYLIGSQNSEFKNTIPFDGVVYLWAKVYF